MQCRLGSGFFCLASGFRIDTCFPKFIFGNLQNRMLPCSSNAMNRGGWDLGMVLCALPLDIYWTVSASWKFPKAWTWDMFQRRIFSFGVRLFLTFREFWVAGCSICRAFAHPYGMLTLELIWFGIGAWTPLSQISALLLFIYAQKHFFLFNVEGRQMSECFTLSQNWVLVSWPALLYKCHSEYLTELRKGLLWGKA